MRSSNSLKSISSTSSVTHLPLMQPVSGFSVLQVLSNLSLVALKELTTCLTSFAYERRRSSDTLQDKNRSSRSSRHTPIVLEPPSNTSRDMPHIASNAAMHLTENGAYSRHLKRQQKRCNLRNNSAHTIRTLRYQTVKLAFGNARARLWKTYHGQDASRS